MNHRKTDQIKVRAAAPAVNPVSVGVLVVLLSLVLLIQGMSGM